MLAMSMETCKTTPRDRSNVEVGKSRSASFDTKAPFEEWSRSLGPVKIEPPTQLDVRSMDGMQRESLSASDGEVIFSGVLKVDGLLKGNIRSAEGTLVLTEQGRVEADIDVRIALINGHVEGNIRASEHVVLDRNARVVGNIHTASLTIRDGAWFEGKSFLIHQPASGDYANPCDDEPKSELVKAVTANS
jgi:cytoskeletal protein CcmA (bactofilin family)